MVRASAFFSLALTSAALGQFNFAEEFNVDFTYAWGDTPPFPVLDIDGPTIYDGLPVSHVVEIDDVQTILFGQTLAPRHVRGMIAAPTLTGMQGRLTARMNTVLQDGQRIDGFFLMMLIDAQDASRWISTFFFGSDYSTNRLWGGQGSFGPAQSFQQNYANNTWYRPRISIDGTAFKTTLLADDGVTQLGEFTFNAPPGYFSGQWKVGFGQYMGLPNGSNYQTAVAVDWIRGEPIGCGPADIGTAGGLPGSDNQLDNNDFIAFITYFFASDPIADRGVAGGLPGSDGLYDNNDFIVFITQFFEGC